MKILHTADWHLGKDLYNYDRKQEFENFFLQLEKIISDNLIDILIIAGDIFDTASPSNYVAKTYYGLINLFHDKFPDLEIVIIGGNHDSPSYLNAPKQILETFKTHIVSVVSKNENGDIDFDSFVLDFDGKAIVCAVPFLRRGDLYVSKDKVLSVGDFYSEVVKRAVKKRGDRNIPIIATGHLTTLGARYTSNFGVEQIGGEDSVDLSSSLEDVSYLALGHIHRAQPVDNKRNQRYSGSPLAFSFAEKDYQHSVTVAAFSNKELVEIKLEKILQQIPLKTIPDTPKTLQEVKEELLKIPSDFSMYLEVNLLPEFINPDNKAAIVELLKDKKAKFCTFKRNISTKEVSMQNIRLETAQEFSKADPLEVIRQIYKNKIKVDLSDKFTNMLKEIISEL